MIRRLERVDELAAASRLCRSVASSDDTFAPDWLTQTQARVIAQESGRHIESDEAPLIARAFLAAGGKSLLAIVNDSLPVAAEAYEVSAAAEDLVQISDELIGVNFVLLDAAASHVVLLTAYDFKLVAGPISFVTAIAGEPAAARDAFIEFIQDQTPILRATAERAGKYMSWIGNREK